MKAIFLLFFCVVSFISTSIVYANGNGRTGSAVEGCNNGGWGCHGGSSSSTTFTITPQHGASFMAPGETRQFTVIVAHATNSKAGINAVVRNPNNSANAGTMTAGTGTKVSNGEITHNGKQDITNGQCTFTFSWTAPTTSGTYSLRVAGNAVNNNGNQWGDSWDLATPFDITVENPVIQEPSSGTMFCRGEVAVIRWSQPMYEGNVRLEISPNGTTWSTIGTTTGYPNFYQWNVPSDFPPGTTYRMRIVHATKGTVFNTTNYQFSILPSPIFTKQPTEVRTCKGNSATFSVNVDFPTNYSYQWRLNFNPIQGATSSTYTIPSVTEAQMGNYDCVVTGCRSVQSSYAALILSEAPYFIQQPENTDGCLNQPVELRVSVRGQNAKVQWRFRGNPLAGKTDTILTIPSLSPADTGLYDAISTGTCSPNATSLPARVSFMKPSVIKSQSRDTIVCLDQELTLKVEATGRNLRYRWKFNGNLFVENESATFTILNVGFPSVGTYAVDVVTPCGAVTPTIPFKVNMWVPAAFSKQPRDTSVRENSTVILTVAAIGDNPKFQWYKGTAKINGATTNTLTLKEVKKSDAAKYSCYVSNPCGSVQSKIATVTVTEAPAEPLLSLNFQTQDFACTKTNESSQKIITTAITNIGGQKLNITSIKVQGNDETAFTVTPQTLQLDPGKSGDLTIKFLPKERRTYSTQLVFESNSSEKPAGIAITGKGCIVDVTTQNITLSDPITINTSRDTNVIFTNAGDYDVVVNETSVKGTASADYQITNPTLPDTLQPSETITIPVKFTPSVVGIRSAYVEISTNEGIYKADLQCVGENLSSVTDTELSYGITVMPNPSNGTFFVRSLNEQSLQHVKVLNTLGSTLWESGTLSGMTQYQVTLPSVTSGQYYLQINKGNSIITLPIQIY